MWIEKIFIEHFGAYNNLEIEGLRPYLTLVVGPNEAGKTTMMEFVRSIFFGFRKKNICPNTYENPDGVLRRGHVAVRTAGGRLQIHRVEKRGQKEGILTVLDDRGNSVEPSTVPVFGPGIHRKVYETLFAFDLDRMRDLDHEALRGKIVAAALGSIQTNPLEILKKLEDRSKRLMKRSHNDPESLLTIQGKIGEIDKKLRILQERPNVYYSLKSELDRAFGRRKELSKLLEEEQTELRELERLSLRKDDWTRLVAIDRELEQIGNANRFPVDGVPRLGQALEQFSSAQAELFEIQGRLDHILQQLSSFNPDPGILDNSAAILAISREAISLEMLPNEIEKRSAAWRASKRMLAAETNSLGTGWDEGRVMNADPSLRSEQDIRAFLDSFQYCKDRIKDLEVRLSESKERNRILQEKITANRQQIDSLTDQCRFFLSLDSRALLQEWKTNQDRLQNLEERLSGCNRQLRQSMAQKTDLDEKTAELDVRNRSIVRAPIFWGITCAILSGVTGGVTYWSLNDFYLGWAVLVLSAAFSVPIVIFSEFRRRRRSRIRNELSKSAKLITADLAELEGRRRSNLLQMHSLNQKSRQIAETVLQRPSASLNDIIQAETQSARAEQPYRRRQALEAGLKSDLTDLRSENNKKAQIERSLEEEHQDLEEVEAKWKKWILGQGLDQDLGPQIAVEFIRKIRDLKRSLQDLDEEHRAIDLLNRRWQEFCQKVDDLSSFMGAREPGGNPLVAVEYWTRKEREAREAFAEKKSILQKEADLKLQLSVSKAKALEAQDRILALYEAAEVADEEAFREKSRLHERFERLDHERRIIVERLVQGLSFKDEETVRESLSAEDWERNERRLDFLKVNLAVMRAESEDLATLCGKLTIEIDRMEHEDESDQLLAEKQEQTARMNKGVKELIETRIAHVLLENTLKLYEVEKQPRVLEKTSEIFRNITGNGFRRVIFPLNGASIKVERANGTSVDEELLSRGTLEQLYLSFRLAHLDVYHRDKPSIPLVMDDVLVNFDPVRARRTASVLAEFSGDSGIQIIFFTCHPHTGDLFPQCTPILRMGSTISSPKI